MVEQMTPRRQIRQQALVSTTQLQTYLAMQLLRPMVQVEVVPQQPLSRQQARIRLRLIRQLKLCTWFRSPNQTLCTLYRQQLCMMQIPELR
jgi:hypothetical protein